MMMHLTNGGVSPRTSFAMGGLAGALLLGAGMALGGAAGGGGGRSSPDAHFGDLTAHKLDITDGRGRVVMRLRGNHENGGNLRVFDRSGDVRIELRADGSVRTYGGNEKLRALLGRDPHGWGDRRGGVLELFDPNGRHIVRLPGSEHPRDCTCEVCARAPRPAHDPHHDHDHRYERPRDPHDDRYDRPRRPSRPARPGWWREEDE